MLVYYELKGLIISLVMLVMSLATGWGRQPSEAPPPIGYGVADITDSDK